MTGTVPRFRGTIWITLATVLWLGGIVGAFGALWKYKTTPGLVGLVHSRWPAGSRLVPPSTRPVLMMFAHPMCPCTEASLTELKILMTRFRDKIDARIVVIQPDHVDADWAPEAFRKEAGAIPGVHVLQDPRGEEAKRFGAETSGYVVIYGPAGNLLFHGGITDARGHEGDNAGVDQISALLNGQIVSATGAPVFGCSLSDEEHP